MPIPERETLRLIILERLSDSTEHSLKKLLEYLAVEKFQLSISERKQPMRDGKKPMFDNRVRWALMDLKKAGLIAKTIKPKESTFKITESGLEVLRQQPSKLDAKYLMQFIGYREWKNPIDIVKKAFKKRKKKITYTKGIIVLLDSLGTKGKWKTEPEPGNISELWNRLLDTFRNSVNREFEGEEQTPAFLTFSDTIMIIVKTYDDIKTTLIKLASSLRVPFIASMALEMPIRGCITTGLFHLDRTFIVGPAIEEAAEYYELPQWIGISASPNANREIEKLNNLDTSLIKDYFFRCDIPLRKSVEQNAWALKWPENSDDIVSETSEPSGNYATTRDLIDRQLAKAGSINAALKWRNTLKFYELIIENNN